VMAMMQNLDWNYYQCLAQKGQGSGLWIGLILMIVVFYVFIGMNSRKDKQKRKEMLANVKKNDRVMTVGGIIGSVVSVSDNDIMLKVDESANVKMTVVRGAIQRVLAEDEKPREIA